MRPARSRTSTSRAPGSPRALRAALNAHLRPEPVAVVAAAEVADDFHARFDAVEREYLFRLVARRAPLVHDRGLAWRVGHRLDLAAMREGAAALLGRHDFTTFRSLDLPGEEPGPHARRARDRRGRRPRAAASTASASGRARSCTTRSAASSARSSGSARGAWPPERVGEALAARDRAACGPVCPPDGLYLAAVRYPSDPLRRELAAPSAGARARAGSVGRRPRAAAARRRPAGRPSRAPRRSGRRRG